MFSEMQLLIHAPIFTAVLLNHRCNEGMDKQFHPQQTMNLITYACPDVS